MSKKVKYTWRSSIKIERPCTTWLGRIGQRRRIRKGRVLLLDHPGCLTGAARQVFSDFFLLLDELPYSTTHPTEQMTVSTSYSMQGELSQEAHTSLYHQKQLVQQLEWKIYPCNGGLELTVLCSKDFYARLIALERLCYYPFLGT